MSQKHFQLENYSISFVDSSQHLAACSLEVGDSLRILGRLHVEEYPSSQACIELLIKSQNKALANENALYTNRIKRLLQNCILVERYEKSKFIFTLDILDKKTEHDIYHHLINLISFCLLAAKIEVRYVLTASSCFLDAQQNIIDETQARHVTHLSKNLNQVFMCKRIDNDDDILSFKINGNLNRNQELGTVFSFLIAASNKVGREMVKYVMQKA